MTSKGAGVPDGSSPSAGCEDLVAMLHEAKLPLPPMPFPFKTELVRLDPWVWATRPVVAECMYMFDEYVDETFAGGVRSSRLQPRTRASSL